MAATIWQFLVTHRLIVGLVAFWLLSNIVTALPSPNNGSGGFYKWFFAFGHATVGSIARVWPQARVFNDPTSKSATYFAKPNGGANGGASNGVAQPPQQP